MAGKDIDAHITEPCWISLLLIAFGALFRPFDVLIAQNRPRRNLLVYPFIRSRQKLVELRDPVMYRAYGASQELVNKVLVKWLQLFGHKILYRATLGLCSFEIDALRPIQAPEYGFRSTVWEQADEHLANLSAKLVDEEYRPLVLYAGNVYSNFYASVLEAVQNSSLSLVWAGRSSEKFFTDLSSTFLGQVAQIDVYGLYKIVPFVISINDTADINYLPSKTIELFGSGCYILHFTTQPNDRISKVVRRWGLGQVIDRDSQLEKLTVSKDPAAVLKRARFSRRVRKWLSEEKYFERVIEVLDKTE